MIVLPYPSYPFKIKAINGKDQIFDPFRKIWVLLTPEEWVRQHVIQFLLQDKKYPKSHINVEKLLKINHLTKRYDVVVYKPNGDITILVECKAPEVKITQSTFDQIARYNMTLNADYLMVTNGLNHYFCKMDYENEKYDFLADLPEY